MSLRSVICTFALGLAVALFVATPAWAGSSLPPSVPLSAAGVISVLGRSPANIALSGVTTRPPTSSDDSTKGYAVGNLWNYNGAIYQNVQSAVGYANWNVLTSAPSQALPIDALGGAAPVLAVGNRRLTASYVGPIGVIERSTDSTLHTVVQLPTGSIDMRDAGQFCAPAWAVSTGSCRWMWNYDQSGASVTTTAAAAVAASTTLTVASATGIAVGQSIIGTGTLAETVAAVSGTTITMSAAATIASGAPLTFGNSPYSASFATAPLFSPLVQIGGNPAVAYDTRIQGTITNEAMIIPNSVTVTGNADTAFVIALQQNAQSPGGYLQLTGSVSSQGFGYNNTSDTLLLNYVAVWQLATSIKPSMSPFVTGFESGSSKINVWYNDSISTLSYAGARTEIGGTLGAASLINSADGMIAEGAVILYGSTLATTSIPIGNGSLDVAFGIYPQVRDVVDFEGDSIREGYGTTFMQSFTMQEMNLLPNTFNAPNMGSFGQTIEARVSAYPSQEAVLYNPLARNNLIVNEIGTNSFNSGTDTPAVAYAALTSLIAMEHATGFTVIAETLIPNLSDVDSYIPAYNALVLANAARADLVCNVGSDPTMSAAGSTSNTSLYFDGTHPVNLGASYMAPIEAGCISAMLH